MTTLTHTFAYDLPAEFGHVDITGDLNSFVRDAGISDGILSLSVVGSTGGLTTIEYESGALQDLHRAFAEMAPADAHYEHNARWGDGNGFSHVRSALLGTGNSYPVIGGQLALGTWQQVVVLNFDNRSRRREVVAVLMGA